MLTDKMDLRGGRTLWRDSPGATVRVRRKLSTENCDVAVVGGGVSGALIALTLVKAGFDVVVVDRRKPGLGSTAASTAMIQFELDTPLRELAGKIGAQRAARAYRRSFRAVADLKTLVVANKISCDWRDRDALYLAGDQLGWRALKMEATARRRAGLPSQYIGSDELFSTYGIERNGAIQSQGAAELDPARLSAGALNVARKKGCRIYGDHEVVVVASDTDNVHLETDKGGEIHCKKAVFATGYETIDGLPKGQFDITSSWAIATKPVDRKKLWPTRCLIWEASDPYLYVRTTAGNRIVAGGEDSDLNDAVRRDAAIANKSARLLSALNVLLPGRDFEIDYAWAGAFAVSPTGLPIFAEVEGLKNCMAVLGCGGNGITFSMIASQIVEAWVLGRRDPDMSLFDSTGT
jgi:glycine/D-amino acid oxidase-like deaminating enzyme